MSMMQSLCLAVRPLFNFTFEFFLSYILKVQGPKSVCVCVSVCLSVCLCVRILSRLTVHGSRDSPKKWGAWPVLN